MRKPSVWFSFVHDTNYETHYLRFVREHSWRCWEKFKFNKSSRFVMIFNLWMGKSLKKFEWPFFQSFVWNRHLRARPKFLLITATSSSASRASKKEIFIFNNQSSVWCYLGMLFSSKSLNNFTEFNIETKERRQNSPEKYSLRIYNYKKIYHFLCIFEL